MKKLGIVIQYECVTSFKYIWLFYAIEYAIVLLISVVIAICTGSMEHVGSNCLEINTMIYAAVLGVLGFHEDFKMLIQNGFTRRYIYLATVSMFAFISGIMALVDTVMGNALHYFLNGYFSVYGALYGYYYFFVNWIWLLLLYMVVCSLLYLVGLVVNRYGKRILLYLGVVLLGLVLFVTAMFRYILPGETVRSVTKFLAGAMGFMSDGTKQLGLPLMTLFLIAVVLELGAYAVIRRTELK